MSDNATTLFYRDVARLNGGPYDGRAADELEVIGATEDVVLFRRFFTIGLPDESNAIPHLETAFYTKWGHYIGRVCGCGQSHGGGFVTN